MVVDKELEKVRKQNKEIYEQWKKEIEERADRISIYLWQVGKSLPEAYQLKKDEVDRISVFLAESVYPNLLNKSFPHK